MNRNSSNPYLSKPDYQFWRRSISGKTPDGVDPIVDVPFSISTTDKVATAGSCFAQHIARHLQASGFCYFVPENQPAFAFSGDENYGTFSARYGNIYTVRQLRQLFERAYGLFKPADMAWRRSDGKLIDPFRPKITASGFDTLDELFAERTSHLSTVQQVFEDCDLFVFTLGLTEGWVARGDGAVFPLAPGTVASIEKEEDYEFHNFTVAEMTEDLTWFLTSLRKVNPQCRVMLTVSPVALVATYRNQHVLTATTYSKSALRVVAEMATQSFPMVAYFPSYEIITGPQARSNFFAEDLREVTQEGVAHVMSLFSKHYLTNSQSSAVSLTAASSAPLRSQLELVRELQGVICDEEQIENPNDH